MRGRRGPSESLRPPRARRFWGNEAVRLTQAIDASIDGRAQNGGSARLDTAVSDLSPKSIGSVDRFNRKQQRESSESACSPHDAHVDSWFGRLSTPPPFDDNCHQ